MCLCVLLKVRETGLATKVEKGSVDFTFEGIIRHYSNFEGILMHLTCIECKYSVLGKF